MGYTKPVRCCRQHIGLGQRGMTLIEVLVATLVLMFGVVAVMQMTPAALLTNLENRYNSAEVVIGQRLLDQMVAQPLNPQPLPASPTFTDVDGHVCNLGSNAAGDNNVLKGSPVVTAGSMQALDFNPSAVPGYNFNYVDTTDPSQPNYDVRWAVVTVVQSGTVVAKRFVVGVWKLRTRRFARPTTLDTWVLK